MTLRVLVHDVGHGQAVHVFTPNGKAIVIDLGCRANFSPLGWLREGRSEIDYLIITHPHGDHIDEMLLVNELGFHVRQIWRPKWLDEETVYSQNQYNYTEKLDAYFEMSNRYSAPVLPETDVAGSANNGGVIIDVFASSACGTSNINNHSGVVYIEYAGSGIMISGDNEPPSWRELLTQPGFVAALSKTDIFMASHHGRESGYCRDIFSKKPKLCVVSDGRVQDTDVRARYSGHALGWLVNSRSGKPQVERSCVTTRDDGFIDIEAGFHSNNTRRFLSVKIN